MFFIPRKSPETEPHHNEVKKKGLIRCDAIPNRGRRISLEFVIETVHFIKADRNVDFWELFILWISHSHFTLMIEIFAFSGGETMNANERNVDIAGIA
jgi:hypothetical protein